MDDKRIEFYPPERLSQIRATRKKHLFVLIAVIAIVGSGNILATALRSEATHAVFLIANVLTDIAAGWFAMGFFALVIKPENREMILIRMAQGPRDSLEGTVLSVSEGIMTVNGRRGYAVLLDRQGRQRQIYLEERHGEFRPEPGTWMKAEIVVDFIIAFQGGARP